MKGDSICCTKVSIVSGARPLTTSFTRSSSCWRLLNLCSYDCCPVPSLAKGDVVPRSRHAPQVLLRCPPLQRLDVVLAPGLGWTLPLFRLLGEYRDCAVLHEGECHGLPKSVAPPVVVASVWRVVLTLLLDVDW